MSTGVNLGFATPLSIVDIDNPEWFTGPLEEGRALVLAGVKAAIAAGVSPASLAVLVPEGSSELASSATSLGVLASPRLVHKHVDATAGDHARNAALADELAACSDDAHTAGLKLICALRLTGASGAPASADDIVAAVAGLQLGGVEPDAWMVDTVDADGEQAIVMQARSGGRVNVVVAPRGRVLAESAYGEALREWASGSTDAGAAADQIGAAITAAVRATAAT